MPSSLIPFFLLTPRLVLRHFAPEDLPAAHALYSDPEVMRFSPDGPAPSLEATRDILDGHRASYLAHGFGKWAVALRATGDFIGHCGVAMALIDQPAPEPELGYRFLPKFWGQGYATEAGKAALEHCLSLVGLPYVLGIVEPANTASTRVLVKLGMTRQRATQWHGKAVGVYVAARPAT